MRLSDDAMQRVAAGIEEADTPVAALVAALRLTFLELGAGDLAAEHGDDWKIDGRQWPLDATQWKEIAEWLLQKQGQFGDVERVNLALDWMNLGPTGEEVAA